MAFLFPFNPSHAESTMQKENQLLSDSLSVTMDTLAQNARVLVELLNALPGPKSDCCGAPIRRVQDELCMCTGCGQLCCEDEL